ncbi:methyltransferase domain-containing protein [Plantactinospora sp. S1510]|uniref:Methyltransferase domain-containing protein n=1 Tax=Plantactinospora alkalitolerans TaxID=2789879 RepID=A0ABS0H1M7_9ACTN|nr:methyltransferase domain-containing protein [Plantactinospora alkalitolerans]MBF9132239.1 methyltransferase domain-containing protein [Plantactinospora alkalitolerans]
MWDPATYLRYGDERSRPFYDLTARIGAEQPRVVVDLGCGPGNLTMTLSTRWPAARVIGLDSSVEMIGPATALGGNSPDTSGVDAATPPDGTPGAGFRSPPSRGVGPGPLGGAGVGFAVADARTWSPGPDVDVVVSNAVLQWVPGHEALLVRWARELTPGSWLAVQVPGNFDAASHRALYATAEEPRWHAVVDPVLRDAPVSDAVGYARLLTGAGCLVDAWETTYVHLLSASGTDLSSSGADLSASGTDHPVLTWMEGTALRPVRAALGGEGAEWDAFRARLARRLVEAYPIREGLVYFPFRRVFFVARTGARH